MFVGGKWLRSERPGIKIGHLNDIEDLAHTYSQLTQRIETEHRNAGSDLHFATDHTQEFVIRDEPSLSRLPNDMDVWTHQSCEFQLYYTVGGDGGSDSEVRKALTNRAAFPQTDQHYYRILRVLIGLERPLWVVQHCGVSWQQIAQQRSEESKVIGAAGAEAQQKMFSYIRKVEVWRYRFDPSISYPQQPSRP